MEREALAGVGELDRRLAELKSDQSGQPISYRAQLLALATLPAVSSNPATDYLPKKRLGRHLIEEIMANVVADHSIELVLHWKGDKPSTL
jgi:hypothetical protein